MKWNGMWNGMNGAIWIESKRQIWLIDSINQLINEMEDNFHRDRLKSQSIFDCQSIGNSQLTLNRCLLQLKSISNWTLPADHLFCWNWNRFEIWIWIWIWILEPIESDLDRKGDRFLLPFKSIFNFDWIFFDLKLIFLCNWFGIGFSANFSTNSAPNFNQIFNQMLTKLCANLTKFLAPIFYLILVTIQPNLTRF